MACTRLSKERLSSAYGHRLVGDPVDVVTGANLDQLTDFRLPGAINLDWWRYYDSRHHQVDRGLGFGFRHDFDRELVYDFEGLTYTDQAGRETSFPYIEQDGERLRRGTHTLERVRDHHYRIHQPNEPIANFVFKDPDSPARVSSFVQHNIHVDFEYDAVGKLRCLRCSDGRVLKLCWQDGHLRSVHFHPGDGTDHTMVQYTYDARGFLVEVEDFYRHHRRYEYDDQGRVCKKVDLRGYAFEFECDREGRCVHSRGEDGVDEVRLEYLPLERKTVVTRANGGQWIYSYAPNHAITEILDPYGGARLFELDDEGRTVREIDPHGDTWHMRIDAHGAAYAKVDDLGRVRPVPDDGQPDSWKRYFVAQTPLEWEYGHLIRYPDHLPARVSFPAVLPTAIAEKIDAVDDPDAHVANVVTDIQGLEIREIAPNGARRTQAYDANANVRWYQDFDGSKHEFEYASWNLRVGHTDPLGARTTFTYSKSEELIGVRDPLGTESRYTLDLLDRTEEVHRHDKVRERYAYDAAGNLIEKRDGDGQLLLTMTYGPGSLKTSQTLASGDTRTFKYDTRGRLIEATGQAGVLAFNYDAADKRTEDCRDGLGIARRFDVYGISEARVLRRFVTRYLRPERGTFIVIDPTDQTHRIRTLTPGVTLRELASGTVELSQYDTEGRCRTKVAYTDTDPSQYWSRTYGYSGEGDLSSVEDSQRGTTHFVHDAAHRLREVHRPDGSVEQYEHDLAGNLLRTPNRTIRVRGNFLDHVDSDRFEYNDRDHVSIRHTFQGPVRYHYDSKDQLVRIDFPDGRTWEAEYDALGRRTQKRFDGEMWVYYWDTDRLAAEILPDGRLRMYVYPDEIAWVPLLFIDYDDIEGEPHSGKRYYVFTNQIGCPELIQDEHGQNVWHATIEPYGTAHIHTGHDFHQPLRFPGHYYDAETGLHDNRFRTYSPELGRYLQSDPSGISGGINLYAYCDRPLTQVDLRGLEDNCPRSKERKRPDEEAGPDGEGRRPPIPEGGISIEQRRADLKRRQEKSGREVGRVDPRADRDPANFFYQDGRYQRRPDADRRRPDPVTPFPEWKPVRGEDAALVKKSREAAARAFEADSKRGCVAADGPDAPLTESGYSRRTQDGIGHVERQPPEKVRSMVDQAAQKAEREAGAEKPYQLRNGGAVDGAHPPGQAAASHAEKQQLAAGHDAIGVDRDMCSCCIGFMRSQARYGDPPQSIAVTDGSMTRVFRPDGSVTEYHSDGKVVQKY